MPPSASMSSGRFWSLTIGLLLVWAIVIATAATQPAPASALDTRSSSKAATKSKALWREQQDPGVEQRNAHNCKTLCQHCGCLGFYCGEECICEYNKHHGIEAHSIDGQNSSNNSSSDSSDTECIATMQKDALKLRIPFEMLIQGPSNNRFVRNALQFDQNAAKSAATANDANRNRRSTVVIYRPATAGGDNLLQNPADSAQTKKALLANARHKRSIGQLDWFSDLANTLVRPAPLGGIGQGGRKREATGSEEEQAGPMQKLESWFSDQSNLLVRPAPLFGRQSTAAASETDDANDASGLPVGRVLKQTLRQFQDADFGEALRTQFKEGADMLQNTLDTSNFNIFPQNMREQFAETLRGLQQRPAEPPTSATLTAPAEETTTPPQFRMRWFRPVRFLQRVQQALKN